MGRLGTILDTAVNYLAEVIRNGAEGAKGALAGLVQSLASSLIPAPFGNWIGTIAGAFLNQKEPVEVIPADGSLPVHWSSRVDFGWDVNQASGLLSGRTTYISPAQPQTQLVISYQEGVEDLIAAKAATSVNNAAMRPAGRLAYA
jgi:hypothetical protein